LPIASVQAPVANAVIHPANADSACLMSATAPVTFAATVPQAPRVACLMRSQASVIQPLTSVTALLTVALIWSQCLLMTYAATPIGPVRIASSAGQLPFSQPSTAAAAPLIASNAPVTTLRNVSLLVYASTNAATRAPTASTTRPIGLAVSAAFSSHCTVVHATVAALAAICAAFQTSVAALTASTPVTSVARTPTTAITTVLWSTRIFVIAVRTGIALAMSSPARLLKDSLRMFSWPGSVLPAASADPPNSLLSSRG
jgi:hypothetical protein